MQGPPNLALVKAAVIVMAFLILAGVGVVVATLAGRMSSGESDGFGEVAVAMPEGCAIAAAESDGERLIVRLEGLAERGCRQVLVIDLESGALLGRVTDGAAP